MAVCMVCWRQISYFLVVIVLPTATREQERCIRRYGSCWTPKDWSRLSFRGFLDPFFAYTDSEVLTKRDLAAFRHAGCFDPDVVLTGRRLEDVSPPEVYAAGPCCCDLRQNFWLETMRITLSLFNMSDGQEEDLQMQHGRLVIPLPMSMDTRIEASTLWSPLHCGSHARELIQMVFPMCLAGQAALHYLCSREHVMFRNYAEATSALGSLQQVLNTGNKTLWSCLDITPWPFAWASLDKYARETLQFLQEHSKQTRHASAGSIASATRWPRGLSKDLSELPLGFRRCLQPPGQTMKKCWTPMNTWLTSSCLFCCDAQHGPGGYPDCFDSQFTFKACCDASPSSAIDVLYDEDKELESRSETVMQQTDKKKCVPPLPAPDSTQSQLRQQEADQTLNELREDLRAARTRNSMDTAEARIRQARRLTARRLQHKRVAHRRLHTWLQAARTAQRSRTAFFPELDLWVSSKACVHRGRWFLWNGTENVSTKTDGEVDGLEFAFSNAGFCSETGGLTDFGGERVANSLAHRLALVPRQLHEESSFVGGNSSDIEHYPLDVMWGELMLYGSPPAGSEVEWRSVGGVFVKEPLWALAHGTQEMLWLWNLFKDRPQLDRMPLQVVFMRWATYEFALHNQGIESSKTDRGALVAGDYVMQVRNSRPSPMSLTSLMYDSISEAAAKAGSNLPLPRVLDRRGVVHPKVLEETKHGSSSEALSPEDIVAGDPAGTLCFDHVLQPFRSWPGGAEVFNSLREDLLARCGIETPATVPRRLVVIERGPSILGGGRRERHWAHGGQEMRKHLEAWGRCRGFGVRFVHFGALEPCQMVEELAHAGILLGVHGADLALAALQPEGAVTIEVDAYLCAGGNGTEWQERLRSDEDANLLGKGKHPLPSKWNWNADAQQRLQQLLSSHAQKSGESQEDSCPFLVHADKTCADRRRRYFSEGRAPATRFLGRSGGGWYSELARQRNLLFLNLARCECVGVPETFTGPHCMGAQSWGSPLDDAFSPSVKVDAELHLVPTLDILAEDYFDAN